MSRRTIQSLYSVCDCSLMSEFSIFLYLEVRRRDWSSVCLSPTVTSASRQMRCSPPTPSLRQSSRTISSIRLFLPTPSVLANTSPALEALYYYFICSYTSYNKHPALMLNKIAVSSALGLTSVIQLKSIEYNLWGALGSSSFFVI